MISRLKGLLWLATRLYSVRPGVARLYGLERRSRSPLLSAGRPGQSALAPLAGIRRRNRSRLGPSLSVGPLAAE